MKFSMKIFRSHYNVNLTAIDVGHATLGLPREVFMLGDETGAIIDSGTTLAYFPEAIYQPLVLKVSHVLYICLP